MLRSGFLLLNIFWSAIVLCQSIEPYPDNSPDVAAFQQMGLKSPFETWDHTDYSKAIELLFLIYEEDKFALPRMNSEYSGDLFKRLVSTGNYQFAEDKKQPVAFRLVEFEKYRDIDMKMLTFYIEDVEPTERFGTEVIECLYFMLFNSQTALDLYDELKKEVGEKSMTPKFKKGMVVIRQDLMTKLNLVFQIILNDHERYATEDLLTLANKLYFLLPNIKDKKIKTYVKLNVKNMAENHANESIREIFRDMKGQL